MAASTGSIQENKIKITLSSRTKAIIDINKYSYLNVFIYPSNWDYGNADGLCGTIEDIGGTFKLRSGNVQQTDSGFTKSWRVSSNEIDLFDKDQIKRLHPVSYPLYHCNCLANHTITCTDGETEPADCAKIIKFRKSRTCKLGSRTKRHAINHLNQNRKPHNHVEKREAPSGWRNEWTEEKARVYCLQLFNRSKAVRLCSDVPNVDQKGPLANCISDIELMGDTSFSSDAVESIKVKCYHELDSNSTLQNSTSETPSMFHQILEVACVNECSDHGVCTNGTCNCEDHYGGIDCSVDIRDAPIVDSVFNDGYCNLNDDCREISVYGQTFLDTGNTHCKVRAEELFVNTGIIQDAGEYKHQAHVESISEAICTLPKSRKKKSTVIVPENSSVKVYHISVTNDGKAYSNESVVVVFNSACQHCTIDGVKVDCSIAPGYCVSGTRCYGNGAPLLNNECYTCSVNGTSRAWIYSQAYKCHDPTTRHVPVSSTTNTDPTVALVPDASTNTDSTTTNLVPDSRSTNTDPTIIHVPVSTTNTDPATTHHVSVSTTDTLSASQRLLIIGVAIGGAALIIILIGIGLIYRIKIKYTVVVNVKKTEEYPLSTLYTKKAVVN